MNSDASTAVITDATKIPALPAQKVTPLCQPTIAESGPSTSMLRMLA